MSPSISSADSSTTTTTTHSPNLDNTSQERL